MTRTELRALMLEERTRDRNDPAWVDLWWLYDRAGRTHLEADEMAKQAKEAVEAGQARAAAKEQAKADTPESVERKTKRARAIADVANKVLGPAKERTHPDMVTVAIRGPLALKFREMATEHGCSLGKLLEAMITHAETSGEQFIVSAEEAK